MHRFGKVVLSRKGFDSSTGGSYSPFDPETGKYVVLPIPMGKKELDISNPLKYEGIRIRSDCLPGYCETNLKSLMEKLKKKATITVKDEITGKDTKEESEYAHFDPWLVDCPWLDCPWLEGDSNHQIGAFGQIGMAQAHLDNDTHKVGKGSLFLIFSRFQPIKHMGQNRENKIVPDISRENLNKGLYFIYGWLKVKEIIQEWDMLRSNTNLSSRLSRHPHATQAYFDTEDPVVRKKNNTIYIADELLFPDNTIPGCGYFPELNEDLLLTAPVQPQVLGNWIPSRWGLKGFFKENCRSVLKDRGQTRDGSWLVDTNWRWQEAVFDFGESEDFYPWFCKLLKHVVGNV